MKIILARHGEVDERYHKCYNGHIDIGLSPQGRIQAKNLADTLKDERFDTIFCSDLLRAKETLKYFPHAKLALYCAQLREKSWGENEGLSFDEITAQGKIRYENFEQWIDALGGESKEGFRQRVKEFFFNEVFIHQDKNILIVTHAGVIRTLISILNNISYEEAFSYPIEYGSYITIRMKIKY